MGEQRGSATAVMEKVAQTLDTNTSRKVFGEPVQVGDVTVIPAAKVSGGGGGGGGGGGKPGADAAATGQATGEGSGGGVKQAATPVGAFVVKGEHVQWRPAVDVNKVIMGGQIVAIVALLTLRALLRRRRHHF